MSLESIVNDPATVVFLGAGASYGTGLPLGDEGARTIIRQIFAVLGIEPTWRAVDRSGRRRGIAWPRFEVVTGQLSQFDRTAAEQIVKTFNGIGLGSTHQFLARVSGRPRLWLTTNFDDQVERAVASAGRRCVVVSDRFAMARLTRRALGRDLVIKLHGDSHSRAVNANLGVRIDQILRPLPTEVETRLVSLAAGRPILFIGYAMRDWDLRPLVTALVSHAPAAGWIDLGEPKPNAAALAAMPHVVYSGAGSPAALVAAAGRPAPPTESRDGVWESRVEQWLRSRPRHVLIQAAAQLLIDRGDLSARRASLRVQALIERPTHEDEYWRLRREGEFVMRADRFNERRVWSIARALRRLASLRLRRRIRIQALLQSASMTRRTVGSGRAAQILHRALRLARYDAPFLADARSELGYVEIFRGSRRFARGMELLRAAHDSALKLRDPLRIVDTANKYSVGLMRSPDAVEQTTGERVLRDSEQFLREINNPRSLMVWHVNLAEALRIERKFREAIAINRNALRLSQLYSDREVEMNASANIGLCSLITGRVANAERELRAAHRIASRRRGGEVPGNTLLNLGWLRMLLLRWTDAVEWLRRGAISLARRGSTDRAGSTYALEAWCWFRAGHPARARRIMRRIVDQGMRPRGVLKREFDMTAFALVHAPQNVDSSVGKVSRRFAHACEQRAQLLLWIGDQAQGGVAPERLLAELWAALDEARLVPLSAAAAHWVQTRYPAAPVPVRFRALASRYGRLVEELR